MLFKVAIGFCISVDQQISENLGVLLFTTSKTNRFSSDYSMWSILLHTNVPHPMGINIGEVKEKIA